VLLFTEITAINTKITGNVTEITDKMTEITTVFISLYVRFYKDWCSYEQVMAIKLNL
jgi:hypothetical protein